MFAILFSIVLLGHRKTPTITRKMTNLKVFIAMVVFKFSKKRLKFYNTGVCMKTLFRVVIVFNLLVICFL